ncbi:MAG: hypothetical protein ACPG4N_00260 [Gammaproteobacteria bacterium]
MKRQAKLGLALCALFATQANAVVFSVDSVSVGGGGTAVQTDAGSDPQLQNNLYFNDHASSGNTRQVNGGDIGVLTSQNIVSASRGTDILNGATQLGFSVSTGTVGMVGTAVNDEVLAGGAAADLFVIEKSAGSPYKVLDALDIGLASGDNLDAIDVFDPIEPQLTVFSTELYFTVDSTAGATSTGNIYLSDLAGNVTLFKSASTLGLTSGDVIDALVLDASNDLAMFSLAAGSSSLGGSSAADIFMTDFSGSFWTEITHADLGLLSTDDVDALETNAIPEPNGMTLLLGGLMLTGLGLSQHRRPVRA